jgi:hypothetical protein
VPTIDQASFCFRDISETVGPIRAKTLPKGPDFREDHAPSDDANRCGVSTFCTLFATFKIRNPPKSLNHARIA